MANIAKISNFSYFQTVILFLPDSVKKLVPIMFHGKKYTR